MARSRQPSARLADFLPYQLSIASNAVSACIAEAYGSRFGLRMTEWRVMAVLGDAGASTQRELAGLTLMDKVAVNRACKMLEDRGLAGREPNAKDGRSHLLALTEAGEEMHGRIMPAAQEMEKRLFEPFDESQRQTLREMLERLRARAEEIGPGT